MNYFATIIFCLLSTITHGQISVQGFVYESGNRGYIADADVIVAQNEGGDIIAQVKTDGSGTYDITLPEEGSYFFTIQRPPFINQTEWVEIKNSLKDRTYLKHEVKRKPGYIFEITLAEKDIDPNAYLGGLYDTRVEVYNNTLKEDHLVIEHLREPEFKVNFIKGNHYTILIRKEGFLSKRMEAFVDVEGCILCFEGVGQVTPGVADNLSDSNTIGVLLANVEMDRYFEGKVIGLKDIYYELNKSDVTRKGAQELDKIVGFLKDNPELAVELGAHTDSRGKEKYNMELSRKRANSAVEYLIDKKGVAENRIFAQGYGESKLTNNCGNKSDCTEAQHAQNRRTELKILKISNQQEFRTLRQLKADELFDEILQEINEEGQIMIPPDVDTEEFLETQKNTTVSKTSSENSRSLEEEKENETIPDVENSVDKETMVQKVIQDKKSEMGQQSTSNNQVDLSFSDTNLTGPNRYSSSYTGYKIVIHFSRFELSKDHPLFEKFPELDIYKTADGNRLYMVESFLTKKQARSRLITKFKSSFPNAYVIGFESGIITD